MQDSVILFREGHNGVVYTMALPEKPLMVNADRRLLTQAVTNLVKNATEAVESYKDESDPTYRPRVDVEMRQTESYLAIDVIDNGPGLPKSNGRGCSSPM